MDRLDEIIRGAGFPDFRWTDGAEVVTAYWVRMKCTFACDGYAQQANCPPNVPSVETCAAFFRDYRRVAVIHFVVAGDDEPAMRRWKKETNERLLELERQVFLAGYHKSLVLFPGDCSLCPDCVTRPDECRHPEMSRPTPEALAVDVFATVRELGYSIEVLTDRSQLMNRYAFLLVE